MKTAKDNLEVKILTYCHECQSVHTGSNSPKCLKCGKENCLVWFVAGVTIKGWLEAEEQLEKCRNKHCGCMDHIV